MLHEGRLCIGEGLGLHSLTVVVFGLLQVHHHAWPDLPLQGTVLQLPEDLL